MEAEPRVLGRSGGPSAALSIHGTSHERSVLSNVRFSSQCWSDRLTLEATSSGIRGMSVEISRHRVQARTERRTRRGRRRGCHGSRPAARALHGQAAVVLDDRPNFRRLDPLVHAHRLARQVGPQREAAARAPLRGMIDNPVRVGAERSAVAFMFRLGTPGVGLLAPLLAVRGWWLWRACARSSRADAAASQARSARPCSAGPARPAACPH